MNNHENYDENGRTKELEEETLLPIETNDSSEIPTGSTQLKGENGNLKTESEEGNAFHPSVRRLTYIAEQLQYSGDASCGIWCFKGRFLQLFANKKAYVILYGLMGCFMSASYAYFNGTITTLERRFQIPTTNSGVIMVGCEISQLFLCLFLNYYGGRGHRPRWISFGMYTVVVFCLMNALPHFLYGAGEDSLGLTKEFGGGYDPNTTAQLIDAQIRKGMCLRDGAGDCDDSAGNFAPQIILFIAQLISGIGGSIFYTIGASYMDDNIKKSKTPALISFSYFLRTLGPAIGYSLASWFLCLFISPSLTPTIGPKDPRWLGAWWIGWLVIGSVLFVLSALMALFPRTLPRAAARKILASERRKAGLKNEEDMNEEDEIPTSIKDMTKTFKRLIKNKVLIFNNLANVFFILGYMPYWIFLPKYIETIYKQTASVSSFVTGAIGLVFSAIGILASGLFISKFRPHARFLAIWNVTVGVISAIGIFSYSLLGCQLNDNHNVMIFSGQNDSCSKGCHCDYVRYSPVCSPDGRTFISPCHAGCNDYRTVVNNSIVFTNCTCAPRPLQALTLENANLSIEWPLDSPVMEPEDPWVFTEGPCPVDCTTNFYIFLIIVCIMKFSGATSRTSNFLVSIRCVEEKDKTSAMGMGLMIMSLFSFIPSPILFGYLIDTTCAVWGNTCTGKGNCWQYDGDKLRYLMNYTAAGFVIIGAIFDSGVWFFVKDLKIFDEEVEMEFSAQRAKTQRK